MGVCKPNLVKCFGPRLRLWTWSLDFVPGPSFSKLGLLIFSSWVRIRFYTENCCSKNPGRLSVDTFDPFILFLNILVLLFSLFLMKGGAQLILYSFVSFVSFVSF